MRHCEQLESRRLLDGANFNNNPPPGMPANVEFDFDAPTVPAGMTYTVTDLATNQVIPATRRVGTWGDGSTAAMFLDLPKNAPDGDYFATMQDAPDNTLLSSDFFLFAGDANQDSKIDSSDFNSIADHFNGAGSFSDGDYNRDGTVNALDFNAVASGYGKTQGFTPRFTCVTSDDPQSIFDVGLPIQYTFRRTMTDYSQDLNIYWSYEPNPDRDTARPNIDFEAPDLAPGFQNSIYVFTIPAGQNEATLTLYPLHSGMRGNNMKVIDIIRGQNSGQQAIPQKAWFGKVPVQTQIWITYSDKADEHILDSSSTGLVNALNAATPHEITRIEIIGHASENSIDLDKNGFLVGLGGANPQIQDENGNNLTPVFTRALAIDADVKLEGCKTGVAPNTKANQDKGVGSIAQLFSKALPGRFIYGYRGTVKYARFTRQLFYGKKRVFHNGELILEDNAPPLFSSTLVAA